MPLSSNVRPHSRGAVLLGTGNTRMQTLSSFCVAVFLILASQTALSQHLPAPSRTVFKCENGGKTFYSDSPCLGAKKIDVEPTRGLNKSTGSERTGKDVSREMQREQFAEAVKPVTGLTAKQFETAGKRQKLDANAQRRCQSLDAAIPNQERQESTARSSERQQLQSEVFNLRTEYRRLGC